MRCVRARTKPGMKLGEKLFYPRVLKCAHARSLLIVMFYLTNINIFYVRSPLAIEKLAAHVEKFIFQFNKLLKLNIHMQKVNLRVFKATSSLFTWRNKIHTRKQFI